MAGAWGEVSGRMGLAVNRDESSASILLRTSIDLAFHILLDWIRLRLYFVLLDVELCD
jgi:hypothetical protein